MGKQRYIRNSTITVKECERCKKSHDFPIEIIFDKEVNALGMMRIKSETYDVVLTCPETSKEIVISVPVILESLDTLVRVQPKG
jgi:hypothetical protein